MRLRNRDTNCRALCPFGKARFTSPAIDMRPLSGSSDNVCLWPILLQKSFEVACEQ